MEIWHRLHWIITPKVEVKVRRFLTIFLGVDKATAITIMTTTYGLTPEQAQTIAQYTHPDNPTPDVLITSSDMVGKAGWWSYFGSWNFTSNNGTNYQYLACSDELHYSE